MARQALSAPNAALQRAALSRASDLTRATYRAQLAFIAAADERRRAITHAKSLGCSYREIARACGVTVNAIFQITERSKQDAEKPC